MVIIESKFMINNALTLKNITKIYPNNVVAIKKINLKIKNGDFYALLGPNGAGKSTTIGIVSSLIKQTTGVIKIFGYDLNKSVMSAKSKIGLVPQEFNFNLFETVIQILINQAGYYGIPKKKAMLNAEKYLKKLNLWQKRNFRACTLSSGMKRRLMITRAIIHEPKLLILDEPTAGVDVELRRLIWLFLKELNEKGVTIILTTHYLEEAEILCRHIGIIQCGELIENTSMKKLLSKIESETFILNIEPNNCLLKFDNIRYKIIDYSTIEVNSTKKIGLNKIFNELNKQGIKVISMRNKTNRLEKFCIELNKREKND